MWNLELVFTEPIDHIDFYVHTDIASKTFEDRKTIWRKSCFSF